MTAPPGSRHPRSALQLQRFPARRAALAFAVAWNALAAVVLCSSDSWLWWWDLYIEVMAFVYLGALCVFGDGILRAVRERIRKRDDDAERG